MNHIHDQTVTFSKSVSFEISIAFKTQNPHELSPRDRTQNTKCPRTLTTKPYTKQKILTNFHHETEHLPKTHHPNTPETYISLNLQFLSFWTETQDARGHLKALSSWAMFSHFDPFIFSWEKCASEFRFFFPSRCNKFEATSCDSQGELCVFSSFHFLLFFFFFPSFISIIYHISLLLG